jgi:hypothetical protein
MTLWFLKMYKVIIYKRRKEKKVGGDLEVQKQIIVSS